MGLFNLTVPARGAGHRRRVFRLVHWPDSRAVTVRIWHYDGAMFADVTGPLVCDGNSYVALGTLGRDPMRPEPAIDLAMIEADLRNCDVVVDLDDPSLWDPRWGLLLDDVGSTPARRS